MKHKAYCFSAYQIGVKAMTTYVKYNKYLKRDGCALRKRVFCKFTYKGDDQNEFLELIEDTLISELEPDIQQDPKRPELSTITFRENVDDVFYFYIVFTKPTREAIKPGVYNWALGEFLMMKQEVLDQLRSNQNIKFKSKRSLGVNKLGFDTKVAVECSSSN
jgi:hypothetical protein